MINNSAIIFTELYNYLINLNYQFFTDGDSPLFVHSSVKNLKSLNSHSFNYDSFYPATLNDYTNDFSLSYLGIYIAKDKPYYDDYYKFLNSAFTKHPQARETILDWYVGASDLFNFYKSITDKQELSDFIKYYPEGLYHIDKDLFKILNNLSINPIYSNTEKSEAIREFFINHQYSIEQPAAFPYFRNFVCDLFKNNKEELNYYNNQSYAFQKHLNPKNESFFKTEDNTLILNINKMLHHFNIDYMTIDLQLKLSTSLSEKIINSLSTINTTLTVDDKTIYIASINNLKESNKDISTITFNLCDTNKLTPNIITDIFHSYFNLIKQSNFTRAELFNNNLTDIQQPFILQQLLTEKTNTIQVNNYSKQKKI